MKLLKLFAEEEEETIREEIYCMECNKKINDEDIYYDNTGEKIYCSYECYLKELNREYFE